MGVNSSRNLRVRYSLLSIWQCSFLALLRPAPHRSYRLQMIWCPWFFVKPLCVISYAQCSSLCTNHASGNEWTFMCSLYRLYETLKFFNWIFHAIITSFRTDGHKETIWAEYAKLIGRKPMDLSYHSPWSRGVTTAKGVCRSARDIFRYFYKHLERTRSNSCWK